MLESTRAAFGDYDGAKSARSQVRAPEARPVGRLNTIERAITRLLGAPGLIAHRNTLEVPKRLAAIMTGIGFAVFVATSQVGLLLGFIGAAEQVVHAAKADIWIAPANVDALEYPSLIERRVGARILGQPGVKAVEPLIVDWVNWRVSGISSGVAMVGVPASGLSALPVPPANASRSWASAVSVNARSGRTIGIERPGDIAEMGGRTVEVTSLLDDFASFLGGPYVFVDLAEAQQIQRLASDQANYLMVFADAGADVEQLTENLQRLLPDHDVLASANFARRTSNFWLSRTGAGGGFLLTAALGFLIGVVVVSQTLYTSVVQRQREYAALSAIGASPTALPRVVMTEALMCGGAGGLAGLALTYPGVWALQRFVVPWIQVPAMLRVSSLVVAIAMAGLAATVALRTVARTDPATVLRG